MLFSLLEALHYYINKLQILVKRKKGKKNSSLPLALPPCQIISLL
jgi:hypothetical protein